MSYVSRFALIFGGFTAFASHPALSKGITVRFLSNPPEDSVVKYQVMRADGRDLPPVQVGQVPATAASDTLSFADTSAVKGQLYLYSIIGLSSDGGASDPSKSTEVAQPFLALPDSLNGGAQGARFTLPLGADPLSGAAPLVLALEDSSHFTLRFDSASHQLVFAARGEARSGSVVVLATYFGKFTDKGKVWLSLDPAALRSGPAADLRLHAWAIPAAWSPRLGALRIRGAEKSGEPGPAINWSLWSLRGQAIATLDLPGNGSEATWDGRDGRGREVKPASYLWTARGPGGGLLQSGVLRILP